MTKARDLSNLISTGVPNSLITLDANEIPNIDASKITSGSIADARIPASAVSQHATSFDDNKIVNDISTLALRQASDQNKSAYNTNSQSVDVFQDDTGIDTTTGALRNANEYVNTSVTGNEVRYDFETYPFINHGTGLTGIDTTVIPNSSDSGASKFGSRGFIASSSNYLYFKKNSGNIIGANDDFTFSGWFHTNGISDNSYYEGWAITGTNARQSFSKWRSGYSNGGWQYYYNTGSGDNNTYLYGNGDNVWHWWLVVRQSGTLSIYDGTSGNASRRATYSSNTQAFDTITWGQNNEQNGSGGCDVDDAYLNIGTSEYDPTQSSVTIPTTAQTDYMTTNATGNFTGTTITAPSSVSSMGAIITYQDQAGTNALNTDIVLQLSADGGSNYSTATLTAMPDFSTGIKMAKVNDLVVTAGTQLKYKISFANQASGSKEARIRGVSLQY